jgi:hypothetical protein
VFIVSPLGKLFRQPANLINEMLQQSPIRSARTKSYKSLQQAKPIGRLAEMGLGASDATQCLVPSRLVNSSPQRFFLVTSKRACSGDSIYPRELESYFNKIHSEAIALFPAGHVLSEAFRPEIESEQVVAELHLYQKHRQAFLNYEFPHPEVRGQIERDIFGGGSE